MNSPVVGINGLGDEIILSRDGDGERTWEFGHLGPTVTIGSHKEGEPVHVRQEWGASTPPREAEVAPGGCVFGFEFIQHKID